MDDILFGVVAGLLILGACFMFDGCDKRLSQNEAALHRTADALEAIALTITNKVTP